MFLSSQLIRARCSVGDASIITEKTFEAKNVRQASYDLRLGPDSYVVGNDAPTKLTSERSPYLTIPPGQFALLTTFEELSMPDDLLGFITLRNGFKMQGLINVCPDFTWTRRIRASWYSL